MLDNHILKICVLYNFNNVSDQRHMIVQMCLTLSPQHHWAPKQDWQVGQYESRFTIAH
jgi:hypothetical protein